MLPMLRFFKKDQGKKDFDFTEEQQMIKMVMDLKDSFPLPMPEPLKNASKDEGIDATDSRC
jgi:hypothetical protein